MPIAAIAAGLAGFGGAAQAGETDICATTLGNNTNNWSTGVSRTTAQTEDIWWGYNGDQCIFAQENGIVARTVVGGIAQGQRTWGLQDYNRYKFTNQTASGTSYKLQWKLAPTTTQGKWHFEN
ncbi:MAG: hypothetical protein AAB131_01595 [Actinomycetota bacterium]